VQLAAARFYSFGLTIVGRDLYEIGLLIMSKSVCTCTDSFSMPRTSSALVPSISYVTYLIAHVT